MTNLIVPESIILGQVNSISLENWVGITGKCECVADGLSEGRCEGGRNLRKISFVPERALSVHRWHQKDLYDKRLK